MKKVLLIDDEARMLELLTLYLTRMAMNAEKLWGRRRGLNISGRSGLILCCSIS